MNYDNLPFDLQKGSLKKELYECIKRNEYAGLNILLHIAKSMNKKESNAERRLRELRNAGIIEKYYDESGKAVIGYKYIWKKPKPKKQAEPENINQFKLF